MNCCNTKAVYVDNVPGKEYYYCRSCKQEVLPHTVSRGQATADAINNYIVAKSGVVAIPRGGYVTMVGGGGSGGVSTGPMALPTVAHPMSYPVPPSHRSAALCLIEDAIDAALKKMTSLVCGAAPDEVVIYEHDAKTAQLKAGDLIKNLKVLISYASKHQGNITVLCNISGTSTTTLI